MGSPVNSDPLRIMVVDDTVTYRRILSDVVEGIGDAEVVATAPQGRLALARLEQGPMDMVLLDLEMPEMDGLETLGHIRRLYPDISVVMISGVNARAAQATIQALEQGALDFIRKPEGNDPETSRQELKETLRPLLRHVRMRRNLRSESPAPVSAAPKPAAVIPAAPAQIATAPPSGRIPARFEVLGVGVSTGGPNALGDFIPALPKDFPLPILLVQHMPPGFTASLAEHLDKRSAIQVCEASEGEIIRPGKVYIAPGGRHMVVRRRPAQSSEPDALIVGLNDNPPENSCRPSVDVLFRSMAAQYEGSILSLVMTGMGNDGCEGVRAMKRHGCHCLTQTADSCVVYGMPQAVDEAGLSDERVPLGALAYRVNQLAARGRHHGD
jgi:two-component system, chemotaxis family, protein-glutamate methylesterase/glutaminase